MSILNLMDELKYHIVFVTKYRYRIIDGDKAVELRKYFEARQEKWGYKVLSLAVEHEHVHMLIAATPKFSIESLVEKLKGGSSYILRRKFRQLMVYKSLWSDGYFIATCGNVSQETVNDYIRKQGIEETEEVQRTFVCGMLPSKRKSAILAKYLDGKTNADPGKAPAAIIQNAKRVAINDIPLRNDLSRLNIKAGHVWLKVSGGKRCGEKPFWLGLLCRQLPQGAKLCDSYIRNCNGVWKIFLVLSEIRRLGRFKSKTCTSIDLGIKRPVTSVTYDDGQIKSVQFWGKGLRRQIYLREKRRATLQAAGEKFGFLPSKTCTSKYNNRISDMLHRVTRQIVNNAANLGTSIVIGNIRSINRKWRKGKSSKDNRYTANRIPYGKLMTMLAYKANLAGVPLVFADEAYTSKTCSRCGNMENGQRNKRSFACKSCGYKTDADVNGAANIAVSASQLSGYDTARQRTGAMGCPILMDTYPI